MGREGDGRVGGSNWWAIGVRLFYVERQRSEKPYGFRLLLIFY